MSPAIIFTKNGVNIMALKTKNNENEQINFDDLMEDLEFEYEEERVYTTISGKEQQ